MAASTVTSASSPAGLPEIDEPEAWAVLASVDGLGPAGFHALLRAHGTARAILEAAERRRAATDFAAVIGDEDGRRPDPAAIAAGIRTAARDVPALRRVLASAGVEVVTLDDGRYPARLRAIEHPPPVLFIRGDGSGLDASHVVAIVGTRRPTERGRMVAARIAGIVASTGALVVSGLAVGIDGAAHSAAIHAGGITAAVLGSGHDRLFPAVHRGLAAEIVEGGGALISEFWPTTPPTKVTFPRRNRVISGLADATIVVEAGERSGPLITAKWALEQGRQLYLVPGPIDEPRSLGCLLWLHMYPGEARIVVRMPELVADLGLVDESGRSRGRRRRPSLEAVLVELGATAREVARALVAGHGSLDELVATTGHAPATVLGAITILELRGLATSTYGRYRAAGLLAGATPRGTR